MCRYLGTNSVHSFVREVSFTLPERSFNTVAKSMWIVCVSVNVMEMEEKNKRKKKESDELECEMLAEQTGHLTRSSLLQAGIE